MPSDEWAALAEATWLGESARITRRLDSDGLHLDPIDLNFEAPPAGAPAQPNQVEIGVFEILSSRLGDLVNSLWDSGAAQPPVLTTAREEEEVEEAGKAGVRPALAPAT